MYKVIFMGTPDFAVSALKCLIDSPDYEVCLAVSQPDKPVGRKQILVPTPVKQTALESGVEVYQPSSLKTDEAYEKLRSYAPDFIVVAAYGKILPQRVLDIPKYGCVNLHGSLLPKYRGSAPIQRAVINGEKVTGITTMLMDAGVDTGDMLLKQETEIGENETAGELFDRLAAMCPEILLKTLSGIVNGTVTPVKQDSTQATLAPMLDKNEAVIDWNRDAASVHSMVCGMDPWPVARTSFCGKLLKIYGAVAVGGSLANGEPGTASVKNGEIFVRCGLGTAVKLTDVQLEGAKRMSAADFLRGHANADGTVLGQ